MGKSNLVTVCAIECVRMFIHPLMVMMMIKKTKPYDKINDYENLAGKVLAHQCEIERKNILFLRGSLKALLRSNVVVTEMDNNCSNLRSAEMNTIPKRSE